ncbi:MAG TPA: hypothetical protein VLA04_00520 [Verrucomicrobiae bacterium]|nr:hypothetical protein [Verrucomicrobiae bacterium]
MDQLRTFFADTLPKWWSPNGLIQVSPGRAWEFRWVYVALIALLFVAGIATLFLKIRPSVKSRIQSLCWTNVFIGIVLYFFRDQRIPYLGMDLIRFIHEICLIFWINSIVYFARTGLQQELVLEKIQERRNKYLPKQRTK